MEVAGDAQHGSSAWNNNAGSSTALFGFASLARLPLKEAASVPAGPRAAPARETQAGQWDVVDDADDSDDLFLWFLADHFGVAPAAMTRVALRQQIPGEPPATLPSVTSITHITSLSRGGSVRRPLPPDIEHTGANEAGLPRTGSSTSQASASTLYTQTSTSEYVECGPAKRRRTCSGETIAVVASPQIEPDADFPFDSPQTAVAPLFAPSQDPLNSDFQFPFETGRSGASEERKLAAQALCETFPELVRFCPFLGPSSASINLPFLSFLFQTPRESRRLVSRFLANPLTHIHRLRWVPTDQLLRYPGLFTSLYPRYHIAYAAGASKKFPFVEGDEANRVDALDRWTALVEAYRWLCWRNENTGLSG